MNTFDHLTDRRSAQSSKWNRYDPDVLPLWIADMDFAAPAPVLECLHARVEHGIFGYDLVTPALANIIVERMRQKHAWKIEPDHILYLPGVMTAMNAAARALAEPGQGVLIQTPVYGPFIGMPPHIGLNIHTADLQPLPQSDGTLRYAVDFDAFESAITPETRLFFLCSPHNPAGRAFTRAELSRMAEICLAHDLIICSDEIHCDIVYEGSRHTPIAALDPEIARRTVTVIAPSKTFNLAGLFCAIAIVPDDGMRAQIQRAAWSMSLNIASIGFVAAEAAYRDGGPWLEEVLAYLQANRDFAARRIREEMPGIKPTIPEATYLMWLDCRDAFGERDPFTFFLEEARVALNAGRNFGESGTGFLRLNFACPRATLSEALDRMKGAYDSTNR